MTKLVGTFTTSNGSKYLQQLCKHFGHKIETRFSATEGICEFAFGSAVMAADDAGLTVTFDELGEDSIEGAKGVIDKHLERFAFRENFKAMDWSIG